MKNKNVSSGMDEGKLTGEARRDLEKLISDFKEVFENPASSHARALLDYVKSLAKMD